jgi:hypothetical protein
VTLEIHVLRFERWRIGRIVAPRRDTPYPCRRLSSGQVVMTLRYLHTRPGMPPRALDGAYAETQAAMATEKGVR